MHQIINYHLALSWVCFVGWEFLYFALAVSSIYRTKSYFTTDSVYWNMLFFLLCAILWLYHFSEEGLFNSKSRTGDWDLVHLKEPTLRLSTGHRKPHIQTGPRQFPENEPEVACVYVDSFRIFENASVPRENWKIIWNLLPAMTVETRAFTDFLACPDSIPQLRMFSISNYTSDILLETKSSYLGGR
ncbi:hypothetical protein BKA61DRAFT_658558 [Leptodontidium sp. MPI-SDFR-AT-0119]|nr:hypothetical protein BKA61DRAFT_658558 [Leptodontidium sp. MPI-SDFR-AT-0119]